MKTPVSSQSSALLGAAYAVSAAAVFSTAGVIVRPSTLRLDVSFWRSARVVCHDVATAYSWQRRGGCGSTFQMRALALVSSAVLLAASSSLILALRLAPVRHVLLMFAPRPSSPPCSRASSSANRCTAITVLTMAAEVLGLAISVAGSLKAGHCRVGPSSSCCA